MKVKEIKTKFPDDILRIKKLADILGISVNYDEKDSKHLLGTREAKMIELYLYCKINKIDVTTSFQISHKYYIDDFSEWPEFRDILICKNSKK